MTESARPTGDQPVIRERDIAAEQLRLLSVQTRTAFTGNLIVMLLLVGAFWQRADHRVLLAWAGLLALAVFLRVLAANGYLREWPDIRHLHRWQRRITGAILLLSLCWSLFIMLFFPLDAPWLMVLVVILISGLTSASIGSTSSHLPAFLAFTVPMMGTLTIRFLVAGTAISLFVGIAGLAYEIMCVIWARNLNRTIRGSIRLRFENMELINQLRKEKVRAEAASETKSRFLAAASHDLRQPLHALNLYLDLLSNEPNRDKREEFLERSREAGDALTGLLDALLDISRLDSDRIQVNVRVFPIQPLLDSLHREHVLQARQQGIELRLGRCRLQAESDPLLLERILRNLLSNALRYTHEGKILLGCRPHGDRVRVFVADTGIGIPPMELERIFDEFHQLHNPERDRSKGLGLGLAIVRRLAERLDADLRVRSVPGKGSVFSLDLPRGPESPALDSSTPAMPDGAPGHAWRILLIDDETPVLEATSHLLRRWGHEVVAVETPQEAVACLKEDQPLPDLVLCDYRLREGKNGLDALLEMRAMLDRPLPAAILSGDTSPEIRERIQRHRIPLLPKPAAPARLRALVDALGTGNRASPS